MFMGHYGPAVWDTQRGKGTPLVPLWVGFLAVQFIDVVFAILVILGLEGETRMVEGAPLFTIPYSHSFLTSLGWAALGGVLFKLYHQKSGAKGFWVIFGLVFSHWVLDLIVHRPDLPLWPGSSTELGFSLWNAPLIAFAMEIGLLTAAFIFWMRATTGSRKTEVGLGLLFAFMVLLQIIFVLIPGFEVQAGTFDPKTGPQGVTLGVLMLTTYTILCTAVAWIERGRTPKL